MRRGLARRTREPVARLGIDEKSFLKRHQYVSVVADLDRACVLHVADNRKAESLVPYFTRQSFNSIRQIVKTRSLHSMGCQKRACVRQRKARFRPEFQ